MNEFIQMLLNADDAIKVGGLYLICAIVFAENGLFFGFFLPGDYLLFLAGMYCESKLNVNIVTLLSTVTLSSIIGCYFGYGFGWFLGNSILNKKDSLFFKKSYLVRTRAYFIKYGGKTLIVSRFLPVVRTFAPILAGIIKMDFKKFTFFNVVGGVVWVFSLVLAGYYLSRIFPSLQHYVEYVVFFFIALTSIVFIKGYLESRKKKLVKA